MQPSLFSTVDANSLTTGVGTAISNSLTSIGTSTGTTISNSWYSSNNIQPTYITPSFSDLNVDGRVIHELGNDDITYQHEVAVLSVTRDDKGKIIRSKMIKTMWVETLSQGSIDYAASKDPEVSELKSEEIIIKTLRTIKL
jgi:hypothetical protein